MMKEPEIKLFGRKIVVPESGGECSGESSSEGDGDRSSEVSGKSDQGEKRESDCESKAAAEITETLAEDEGEDENENPGSAEEESQSADAVSEFEENLKTPFNDDDAASANHPNSESEQSNAENEQSNATNGQQKPLKKPDKILPCPRCNSMDTKFCYYNNYNVNQPRHFCRSCQRYWTAGGTMRNVPVGAGRRKNKNSVSHCRHITISEALQAAQIDAPNGFHHLKIKPNGTVLSFGPNSPLCESMASRLSLKEKRTPNGIINECYRINDGGSASSKNREKLDNGSVAPSGVMPNSSGDGGKSVNGFSPFAPCIPGIPWPFPWNSAVAFPAVYPPGYPLPYVPTPYLNYGLANSWNAPLLPIPTLATNQTGTSSDPTSPLGKHSRNGELLKPKPNSVESPIVVPKTLRINDPEEAAKSPIWDALGIKYDSVSREGLFKALQPKGDDKKQMAKTLPLLQANPAALSRSISFQETA